MSVHNNFITISAFWLLSYTVCIRSEMMRWTKVQSTSRSLDTASCSRPIKIELIERPSPHTPSTNSWEIKNSNYLMWFLVSKKKMYSLSSPVCARHTLTRKIDEDDHHHLLENQARCYLVKTLFSLSLSRAVCYMVTKPIEMVKNVNQHILTFIKFEVSEPRLT